MPPDAFDALPVRGATVWVDADALPGASPRGGSAALGSRGAARVQREEARHAGVVRAAMRRSFVTGTLDLYLKGLRETSLAILGSTLFLQLGNLLQVNLQVRPALLARSERAIAGHSPLLWSRTSDDGEC